MSSAAKMNDRLKTVPGEKWEPPTTLHVNLKKHQSMDMADVGKKVHFQGHGTVKAIRKDGYEHHMEIDVHKLKKSAPIDLPGK